ncbi:MAG: DUF6273 domain-containing protein [Eubacterium sp.]|nr:DUF6273 domain-containing protein [Eubacterium sp.]
MAGLKGKIKGQLSSNGLKLVICSVSLSAVLAGSFIYTEVDKLRSGDKMEYGTDEQGSDKTSKDGKGNKNGKSKEIQLDISVGDEITFGKNITGGYDDITPGIGWRVADIRDGNMLLISYDSVASMKFSNDGSLSWKDSLVRNYLNGDFYKNAFSEEERSKILLTNVTFKNQKEETSQDYVYIPSMSEIGSYFKFHAVHNPATHDNMYFVRDPFCIEEEDGLYFRYACEAVGEGRIENNIAYLNEMECHSICACIWVKMEGSFNVTKAPFNKDDSVKKDLSYLKSANTGDYVEFGKYTINDSTTYDPITWKVLDKQGDKILLISRDVLFPRYYCYEDTNDVTWENSELRSYLNTRIKNEFFANDELNLLTTNGDAAEEGVFLLSVDEIKKYMPDEASRRAVPTFICGSNGGTMEVDGVTYGAWWTRTVCYDEEYHDSGMIPIGANGFLNTVPFRSWAVIGVRPSVWVDLSNIK